MPTLLNKLWPEDPPLTPMTLSREPVVHRFWTTGVVGLFMGFLVGLLLWLWQQGFLDAAGDYNFLKNLHARLQLLLFAGSFLLGFALQAGPHVLGGPPPSSRRLLAYLPFLWVGSGLGLLEDSALHTVGNGLISLAFAGPALHLLQVTRVGRPDLRLPRGIPMVSAFLLLAAAPWLTLDDPGSALFVLWGGPITAALVAAQQLIHNVLGGNLLKGREATLFLTMLGIAWFMTAMAAFTANGSWPLSGLAWLVALILLIRGTGFIGAARHYPFSAIQVTLVLAFLGLALGALMPMVAGNDFVPDAAVHLLGTGVVTVLILGVAARVIGFFCGHPLMRDRALVHLLFLWMLPVAVRTLTPMGWSDPQGILLALYSTLWVLIAWSLPMADRLGKLGQMPFNRRP